MVKVVPLPTVRLPEIVIFAPLVKLAVPLKVTAAMVLVMASALQTVFPLMVKVPVTLVTAPVAVPPPLKVRLE